MTIEEMQRHLATLSMAHRRRFPGFAVGKSVRVNLADGAFLSGRISSVDGLGFAIDNGADTASGEHEVHSVTWLEVIEGEVVSAQ
jgi:small nuclear ribonucleoprotein (snRNP)-like protein